MLWVLQVGCVQKPSPGRHPTGMLSRCQSHLVRLLSMGRSTRSPLSPSRALSVQETTVSVTTHRYSRDPPSPPSVICIFYVCFCPHFFHVNVFLLSKANQCYWVIETHGTLGRFWNVRHTVWEALTYKCRCVSTYLRFFVFFFLYVSAQV